MSVPIELPELGSEDQPIHVSGWLVDVGDQVSTGDRIAEVLVTGVTFDVVSPHDGRIERLTARTDDVIPPRGVLAWLAPSESRDDDETGAGD